MAPDGVRFGPIRWLRAMVVAVAEAATLRYEVVGFSNTAEDFNNLQPGREFSGIWTLRNTGNRAWDGDFRVAYLDRSLPETADAPRDRMGAKPISTCLLYTSRCV